MRALRGVNAVQRAQADAAAHASLSGAAAPQLNAMLAPLLAVLLRAAGVPALATSALAFSKLQSALVTVEAIALVDTAASLVESFSTDTRTLTVVPGSLFVDAAAGKVVIVSLTALFDVQNATLLGGATPRIGVDIPLAVAAGKNNMCVPMRGVACVHPWCLTRRALRVRRPGAHAEGARCLSP